MLKPSSTTTVRKLGMRKKKTVCSSGKIWPWQWTNFFVTWFWSFTNFELFYNSK